ncbi:MAG: DUF4011 domain-containing protein [Pseudomonadota bacterium]
MSPLETVTDDIVEQHVFEDFFSLLNEFRQYESVGTDDVLGALLPLMRQVHQIHEQGRVAPLDGVDALRVDRGQLWFENARALRPSFKSYEISRLQGMEGALDIGADLRLTSADGQLSIDNLRVGDREAPPEQPVYLPDYRCWEHAVGHHDPLTDIFCLGMLGVSLAGAYDFSEDADLLACARARDGLMQRNPRLHPVVAQLLNRMTEIDRRKRAQDLPSLITGLQNHRQAASVAQPVVGLSEGLDRSQRILTELRGRLYDLSRRNKLIYHKPSSNELNLTEASVPIVLRVETIRPDQLFTWARGEGSSGIADRLIAGEEIEVSEFLRFEEMEFAPPALDKIRAQARKDRQEYGFSQLRLVACFLRWRNLKETPEEPISSPLLLVPVDLNKRRGVKDRYTIQAAGAEAEINPALRQLLKTLYDIQLPATVDLSEQGALDELFQSLTDQIAVSEPGVRLEKTEKPRISLIHRRATRRIDLYRKRKTATGSGVRTHAIGDIKYSYGKSNYKPLGEQLYDLFIRPAAAPHRELAQDPMQGMLPLEMAASASGADGTAELERSGYMMSRPESDSPYDWSFDLCAVTLANFNYRKMSLVRDYDALLTQNGEAETAALAERRTNFEQLFSDAPRPLPSTPQAPALEDTHLVVPSDPTQEAAINRARAGESYVIQGPPGTGKSQTIANLIADYIGRGKRVLFVCEKRAALDVVYQRLEALGLGKLCALVHDSQDDKKAFVNDLRALYHAWIEGEPDRTVLKARETALAEIQKGLNALAQLDQDMTGEIEGEPLHALVRSAAADWAKGRAASALSDEMGADRHLVPPLRDWRRGRDAAYHMEAALSRIGGAAGADPILARHPARFVSSEAAADANVFERLTSALERLGPLLEKVRRAQDLVIWKIEDGAGPAPLAALFAQINYAHRLRPVASAGKLAILDRTSLSAETFRQDLRWLDEARETLSQRQDKTTIWRDKLSPIETETAIRIAQRYEGSWFSFLSGEWRRVKREIHERAALEGLAIKPRLYDVLIDLAAEHEAVNEVDRALRQLASQTGMATGEDAIRIVEERDAGKPVEGDLATPLFDYLADQGDAAADHLTKLARLQEDAAAAQSAIADCFDGIETLPAHQAADALAELQASRDALPAAAPALRELANAPDTVRAALKRLDMPVAALEAAVMEEAVERALAARPGLRETDGAALDEINASVSKALTKFREANARMLLDQTRDRFAEKIAITTRPDIDADADFKAAKKQVMKARQDLEREFNKTLRFRSVRRLLSEDAGKLIPDLKPIWLMSPLSVADVLPLDADMFDVAVFDEASQVPVEDAAPTLFRAPQFIVVGDEKQLPPTNFFGATAQAYDEDEDHDEDEAPLDLDAASFLGQAAKTLPSTLLGWHYRSRSEELISFSNAVFYAGKLISVPATRLTVEAEPIRADSAGDGKQHWREVLRRPISFHHTPFGVYERQRNRGEALYIAEMIRGLLTAKPKRSLGVVAFSEAQQSEIERALDQLAKDDPKFADAYEAELEREEDGAFVGLFVKNLENVQGDERDVILISVCYAPDARGRMRMSFGPINRAGGEKRLNVIFSRAKEHVALVSTVKADAITNDYNTGAFCLKTYLRYAEAVSTGNVAAMRRALSAVAPYAADERADRETPIADQIAQALRERGFEAETSLGESKFVCDVAVRKEGGSAHELAILIDGPAHYENPNLLERHVTKPGVLNAFGWKTLSVLSLDWRARPDVVLGRIERALGKKS